MNIDFHYGVIYAVSRIAGLDIDSATKVAHACQYIDDATTDGLLYFAAGETFERFASAHEMVDHQNVNNDSNRTVWAPFHFLPGGIGESFEEKAICLKDSEIARMTVRHAIRSRNKPNALHRLGVTLHVYVDTWAHKGFSGITSQHNMVTHLEAEGVPPEGWMASLQSSAAHLFDEAKTFALTELLPLGHGAALHFPDIPWAKWHYIDGNGKRVDRDNLPDFVEAADMACRGIRGYIDGREDFENETGLTAEQAAALARLLQSINDDDPKKRLNKLSTALAKGEIPGLAEPLPTYIPKGEGSWKHAATGLVSRDDGDVPPTWTSHFEESDYRKFHDAVKEHRFVVTQEILPSHFLRLA